MGINDEYLNKIKRIQKLMRTKYTKIKIERTKKESEKYLEDAAKIEILDDKELLNKCSK